MAEAKCAGCPAHICQSARVAHPDIENSHDSIFSFLTAAPHPERRAGFRNTISLDQFAAEKIGLETRHPFLSLSGEGFGLSWTRSGALVPSEWSPSRVFARLFIFPAS